MSPKRHERIGWGLLAIFALLGLVLETLHGLKAPFYLDSAHSTRRLLWTLAHAHGMLLGLVHVGFAAALRARPGWSGGSRTLASRAFLAAALLLPGGFLLGGAVTSGGDPNPLVLLSPLGGLAFALGATVTWRAMGRAD